MSMYTLKHQKYSIWPLKYSQQTTSWPPFIRYATFVGLLVWKLQVSHSIADHPESIFSFQCNRHSERISYMIMKTKKAWMQTWIKKNIKPNNNKKKKLPPPPKATHMTWWVCVCVCQRASMLWRCKVHAGQQGRCQGWGVGGGLCSSTGSVRQKFCLPSPHRRSISAGPASRQVHGGGGGAGLWEGEGQRHQLAFGRSTWTY